MWVEPLVRTDVTAKVRMGLCPSCLVQTVPALWPEEETAACLCFFSYIPERGYGAEVK
jgi:hypothetical protein